MRTCAGAQSRPMKRAIDGGSATRPRAATLAGCPAGGGPAGRDPCRPAQDLRRGRAGRRQDLRDAADGARQAEGGRGRRRRRGRDARPQGDGGAARGPRGAAAQADRLRQPHPERVRHRRGPEAAPGPDPGRRAGAHQHPGQPPRQALPRRRGAAGERHRRLHHRQHPAHREPERRGGPDHARARARDGARFHPRPGRCRRARRPDARRPDPAAERGQGLRPQAGRARAQELFLAHQPHRAARARPAAHRRARGRAAARADAGPGHLGSLGRGRAHPGVRQRGPQIRRAGALRQAAGGPAARALDGAVHRDAAQPAVQRDGARPYRRDDAGGRAARRRGHHPSRQRPQHRRRRPGLRPQAERHAHRHRQVHALALVRDPARLGGARPGPARRQHRRARHSGRGGQRTARRREGGAGSRRPQALRPDPLYRRLAGDRCRDGHRQSHAAAVRHRERRSRAADGHRRRRPALRAAAVAARHRGSLAVLQLLLPAADLHLHHHRSHQRGGVRAVHDGRRRRLQHGRARAHAHGHCAGARAHHRVALRLQPQACRRRPSRRRALGHHLPDRADAEGARRAAAARGRLNRGQGRLPAGGYARGSGPRRRPLGLGEGPQRGPGLRYAAGRQVAVHAHAHGPRHDRHPRHRPRRSRPAAERGPAAPAACPDRPGRAGDRARAPGRGHRPRQAHDGDRASAVGAPHLDLARPQDAARLRSRRGGRPARHGRSRWTTPPGRTCSPPSSTRPSGSTGSSPTCWT